MFSSCLQNYSQPVLCCYVNETDKVQIGKITNLAHWYFERVIFPGQRLIFEAPPEAELEIHTGTIITAIISEKIRCDRLYMETKFPVFSHQ
jgi:hypothetical protein